MSEATPPTSQADKPAPLGPNQVPCTHQDESHLQVSADGSADPTDGYEPVPLWLLSIFGLFLGWGGWYLGTYASNFNWLQLDEHISGQLAPATQQAEDPIALGKRIFSGNCVSCHQGNGQGLRQYPSLNGSEWVHLHPGVMKRIILHGLEGPITVKGANFNNAMPPLGQKLSDKQIAAVISFVRTNAEWGNKAEAITPESVAATRTATKARTAPWSASELQAIKADDIAAAPASQPAASQPATKPK